MRRQRLAALGTRFNPFSDFHPDAEAAKAGHRCEGLQQCLLIDERRGTASLVVPEVLQGEGLHGVPSVHGSLEQRGPERKEPRPIGGGAFRKEDNDVALRKAFLDPDIQVEQVPSRPPAHVEGVMGPQQGAQERPACDLRLGNEAAVKERVEDKNIEPGHVIRDDQRPGSHQDRRRVEPDPQDVQQLPRPLAPHSPSFGMRRGHPAQAATDVRRNTDDPTNRSEVRRVQGLHRGWRRQGRHSGSGGRGRSGKRKCRR